MRKIINVTLLILTLVVFPATLAGCANNTAKAADLSINSVSTIGGSEDLSQQMIHYEVTVTNGGQGTARDVRVFIDTPATNQGQQTFEAGSNNSPVNLGTDENADFLVSWVYDMTNSTKQTLAGLMQQNVIRVTWKDAAGKLHEKKSEHIVPGSI